MVEPHFKIRMVRVVKKEPGEPTRAMTIIKRAEAYEKYKRMLRNGMELEKLAETMRHPAVRMALETEAIETEIFAPSVPEPFEHRIAPFVAAIGHA
jgi:hypothetical protein